MELFSPLSIFVTFCVWVCSKDRLINLGGGRGAAGSTTEMTLFLLGNGGGNPAGPDDVGSGLGGGEGGH